MTIDRPQRLFAPSPPGALLKRTGAADLPQQPRQPRAQEDKDYLALVRQLPCLKCGLDPCGLAAHLRMNSGAFNKRQAMARKPSDKWTTPLCAACHTDDRDAQHKIGEAAFWMALGINPFLVCEQLYAQAGDLVAMRAVIFVAIAQRGMK
jgi:hypothetical protein